MVKYDKRRLNDPISVLQDDDFICNNRRVRVSLSNNERYAAVCSSMGKICVFDLLFDDNVKVLQSYSSNNIVDLQWQPGHNNLFTIDTTGDLSKWTHDSSQN